MKAGIIGLPQSGKKTIFKALVKSRGNTNIEISSYTEPVVVTITVYDERVKVLKEMFNSGKEVY